MKKRIIKIVAGVFLAVAVAGIIVYKAKQKKAQERHWQAAEKQEIPVDTARRCLAVMPQDKERSFGWDYLQMGLKN